MYTFSKNLFTISELKQLRQLFKYKVSIKPLCDTYNTLFRRTRSQIFFKIDVLKNFEIFKGKHLCWSLFSIYLLTWGRAALLKRDSNTGVFLWGGRLSCPILKIVKSALTLKKRPDCVHLWVKHFIWKVVPNSI